MCDREVVKFVELESVKRFAAHRSGRAVYDIILHSLALRDYGFESHGGRGYLTLVGVVCCEVEISASGSSLVQRNRTECVSVIVKPR
jgi:hypothetical protein